MKRPQRRQHEQESLVAVTLAIITLCTFAGADTFFSAPESPTIAHANTSANPYQPVNGGTYIPPTYGVPPYYQNGYVVPYSSSARPLSRATVQRRLKNAKRSAATLERQILAAEDAIDAIQRKIDASPGRANEALEEEILRLTDNLARLDQRFAELHSQIAKYELLLDPSKDASR